MSEFKMSQSARFKHYSESAAKAERAGNYAVAAKEWLHAAQEASNTKQLHWCQHRADFCDRMYYRPFKRG